MKILLVAINAKYIHSNLAVHYLKAYAHEHREKVKIIEYTINHQTEDILKAIYKEKPDVVAFSCYIWNFAIVKELGEEVKQIMPEVKVWLGGPEVSYAPEKCLQENPYFDGVMIGEGEETFSELATHYVTGEPSLSKIDGIAYRDTTGQLYRTKPRLPISMDTIPFPYEDIENFRNKIIYYESSRGCPYSCSYCLSSIERGVRFRSLDLVKAELKAFLDHGVAQVKFVDRTFNCNRNRTMDIWRFIKENDNGITNFHFEITADILSEEELELLASLRPGHIQLEIGVQTTNPDTMVAIRRTVDFERLSKNVLKIKESRNIHQHLDLIAGLPLEGYESFAKSFDDVYSLKPDQLQLGFLKVLSGSYMEEVVDQYGIVYRKNQPYEVLKTDHLSYEEMLKLKVVCEMVEVYYNSGQFYYSLEFMEHFYHRPFEMYARLGEYYERKGYFLMAHSRMRRYEILLEFFLEELSSRYLESESNNLKDSKMVIREEKVDKYQNVFKEILVFDMCLRERIKSRPSFASDILDGDIVHALKKKYNKFKGQVHVEHFHFDVEKSAINGEPTEKDYYLLFEYDNRDPITNGGIYTEISMELS